MIMAIIYRNVGRKKVNELLLLGERIDAQRGRAERAGQQGRRRRTSSTPRLTGGPRKLASKAPVLMRLGKDAMYRQQDMAIEDALEFLRAQLTIAFSTEDIVEGVTAFFEKREPKWKGH